MVSSGDGAVESPPAEQQEKGSPDSDTDRSQQVQNSAVHTTQNEEGSPPSSEPEKALSLKEPDSGVHISQLDKEGSISSIIPGRALQTSTIRSPALHSGQEARTPTVLREKVSEDGYHWRKYGQKLVKGNEYIRSYYKCTHPSCQVKKQLELSHDWRIVDIVCFGQHDHPKPLVNVPVAVGFVLSVEERHNEHSLNTAKEKSNTEGQETSEIDSRNTSQISTTISSRSLKSSDNVKDAPAETNRTRDRVDNDDDLLSKRQKKGDHNADSTPIDKLTGEPRVVVQTMSEIDIVSDGYRWRKYGQKMVKGNPNPRSYYRCSSPGCPVKKHVERASHDPKVIITSYEGQHDHEMPPSRTVTLNATGTSATPNDETATKSGESEIISQDKLDGNLGPKSKPEKPDAKSKTKASHVTNLEKVSHSCSLDRNNSNEQQSGKSIVKQESDGATLDTAIKTSLVSDGRSDEQHCKPKTESEDSGNACGVPTITAAPKSNQNEHHIPKSETVQS